jgi:hypothetical protein
MMRMPRSPVALITVSVVFLLGGISSIWDVALALREGRIDLNFGVLGVPIFFGLLYHSSAWRKVALLFLWIGFFLTPIAAIICLLSSNPGEFKLLDRTLFTVPPYWLSIALVPCFFLLLWQYRVLMRGDIHALFRD